ncbi:hypothetical protein [Solitalea canadensis]|uniref:Uncharacterized protein n=1 Tax=Solitalea canadensis (strain ATCC 29591 / DSM 3403 / JCM 21819 / LMG 8368 / NBRC 15130 / NCIMB 12057 / USAM 9D) TaxID=929556 RepID=H8KXM5_SOLCM|nr:hypothetical protein [Solitalea canadensis]AFD05321.1 hypothetical protein Solca_0169 [Solitalea canadensis DSM 3403]
MLGFFKRTKIEDWEITMLRNVISKLPDNLHYLVKQIEDHLIKGVRLDASDIPGYVNFRCFPDKLQKYENLNVEPFDITGIKIYDLKSQKFLDLTIYVIDGTLNGYSITGAKKFAVDTNNFDISSYKLNYEENPTFNQVISLLKLNTKEAGLLRKSDVYELEINDQLYYHLRDLEDGDFIGSDKDGTIYKFTHDPFCITPLHGVLSDILSQITSNKG